MKAKLANKDSLKAADIREEVSQLQQKSLKLFEAAYKKMAEKNAAGGGSSSDSGHESGGESDEKQQQQKN